MVGSPRTNQAFVYRCAVHAPSPGLRLRDHGIMPYYAGLGILWAQRGDRRRDARRGRERPGVGRQLTRRVWALIRAWCTCIRIRSPTGDPTAWVLRATLRADDGRAGTINSAEASRSASDTIVVGAPGVDTQRCRAYVFTRADAGSPTGDVDADRQAFSGPSFTATHTVRSRASPWTVTSPPLGAT